MVAGSQSLHNTEGVECADVEVYTDFVQGEHRFNGLSLLCGVVEPLVCALLSVAWAKGEINTDVTTRYVCTRPVGTA